MEYEFKNKEKIRSSKTKGKPERKKTTGSFLLDMIIQMLGLVTLAILFLVCSCTYMGWKTVKRAHDIISIPDRLFAEGETEHAVEQYKQVYPELVGDDMRKKALKRIISHEYGTGDKEEAAFWSDLAAENGYDLRDSMGTRESSVRGMVENSYKRWERKKEQYRNRD